MTEQRVSMLENTISGCVAGVCSRLVIAPFDVIKIRLQLQPDSRFLFQQKQEWEYRSLIQSGRTIVQKEGIAGLWKGNASATILYFTYGGAQFACFHELESLSKKRKVFQWIPQSTHTFINGALAGGFATVLTYPFDLLRTRFAVQGNEKIYNGMYSAIVSIYTKEGLRGFYRGLMPTLVQILPLMGLVFESHRYFRSLTRPISEKYPSFRGWDNFICGGLSGAFSKAAIMPFDVVRKRLQVQGPVRKSIVVSNVPSHTGMLQTALKIVKNEGILGLYKGVLPSILKSGPSTAVTFFVVDQCRQYFAKHPI
ncbi:mitochondrial carrier domain-containing protein [Gorgonomyces haynaldii]|nr:mitochondrial carrier domain-containing protein [Gorgonomyces haynaldii]